MLLPTVKASSLAWWLVILGAADLALTLLILLLGGAEANPLIRPHVGTWQFSAVKMGVPLLIVLLVSGKQVRTWPIVMVTALYAWVVAANAMNLKEALGW